MNSEGPVALGAGGHGAGMKPIEAQTVHGYRSSEQMGVEDAQEIELEHWSE
jgi:hypothetical protein